MEEIQLFLELSAWLLVGCILIVVLGPITVIQDIYKQWKPNNAA